MKKKSWSEYYAQKNEATQPDWVNAIETMTNDQINRLEKNLLDSLQYAKEKAKNAAMENEAKQNLGMFYKELINKYPNARPQLTAKMNSIMNQTPSSSQSPIAQAASPKQAGSTFTPAIPSQKQESPESGPYGSTKVEPIPSASASKKMTVEEVKNIGDRIANTPNKLKALYDLALLVKYGKGS